MSLRDEWPAPQRLADHIVAHTKHTPQELRLHFVFQIESIDCVGTKTANEAMRTLRERGYFPTMKHRPDLGEFTVRELTPEEEHRRYQRNHRKIAIKRHRETVYIVEYCGVWHGH